MVAPRSRPVGRRRLHTGISISPVELCAADLRIGSAPWRRPLDPPPLDGAAWPSLTAGLQELARAAGSSAGAGSLAIALLPPLTEVRGLDLPPARAEDLQLLLARNASRYFVNARGPQVVGVRTVVRGGRGERPIVLAAAASARLIASIRASATDAGWRADAVVPAETAWAAAAIGTWPQFQRERAYVVVAHDDRTDVLQLEQGQLAGVRRFRAADADAPMIAEAVGVNARVGVLGAAHRRAALTASLSAAGAQVSTNAGERGDAGLVAAEFADGDAGPVLKTEDTVVRERETIRRARWVVGSAAAALFVAAAIVRLWGVHHQLDLVRRERDALRPKIASTLVGRTTIEAAFHDLAALAAADRDAPQWSAVIAALTDALPDDAHLTAVRARGDSVVVDGLADHAAPVFDALSRVPLLDGAKAAAPVRRELQEDGASLEHFVIAARVRNSGTSPRVAPTSASVPPERAP